jgi:hypothetical protein
MRFAQNGLIGFLLLLFAIGFSPSIGSAEEIEWDQEKVTTLASDLAGAVKDLRKSFRDDRAPSIASGQARSRYRLLDLLRLIESESKVLARQLAAGKGRDETLPVFERINEMRRKAAEDARRMFLPQGTVDKIEAAREVLTQLSPYYGQEFQPAMKN